MVSLKQHVINVLTSLAIFYALQDTRSANAVVAAIGTAVCLHFNAQSTLWNTLVASCVYIVTAETDCFIC